MQLLLFLYQTFLLPCQVLLHQLLYQFLNFYYFQNDLIFLIFSIFFNEEISLLYYSIVQHLNFQNFHFIIQLSLLYFLQLFSENLMSLLNFNFKIYVIQKEIKQSHRHFINLFQSVDHGFLLFSNLHQLNAIIIFFGFQLFFGQQTYSMELQNNLYFYFFEIYLNPNLIKYHYYLFL